MNYPLQVFFLSGNLMNFYPLARIELLDHSFQYHFHDLGQHPILFCLAENHIFTYQCMLIGIFYDLEDLVFDPQILYKLKHSFAQINIGTGIGLRCERI